MIPALGVLTLMALVSTGILLVSLAVPGGRAGLRELVAVHPSAPLVLAWAVVLTASLGSLYMSDVRQLEPCMLCWYQRIAMYPLVIVLGVALLREDRDVWKTALPLALIGAAISAYHVLVQWMPSIQVTQCSASAPCSMRYFVQYGFITIPAMAGTAFVFASILMVTHAWLGSSDADLGEAVAPVTPSEAPLSDPA